MTRAIAVNGAEVELSSPEAPAKGTRLGAVVYFSSASRNTARFIAGCHLDDEGVDVFRLPLRRGDPELQVRERYVLVLPTYGGGTPERAVPPQVKTFLNDPANRKWIRGVVASGNTNFGAYYCLAGYIVARKCHVPLLYTFELTGTPEDRQAVRRGIPRFLRNKPRNNH